MPKLLKVNLAASRLTDDLVVRVDDVKNLIVTLRRWDGIRTGMHLTEIPTGPGIGKHILT